MKPIIFIAGAGRSGTTLLQKILNTHSNIVGAWEFKVIPSILGNWKYISGFKNELSIYKTSQEELSSYYETLITSILKNVLKGTNKTRISEKTPNNIFHFHELSQIFKHSPLIHVIRDGRDVSCSLIKQKWLDPVSKEKIWYTKSIRQATDYWDSAIRFGRMERTHKNYLEIRYENLIIEPKKTLTTLFDFIDEPFEESILEKFKFNTNSIGRWKNELSQFDKQQIKEYSLNDTLKILGYVNDKNW